MRYLSGLFMVCLLCLLSFGAGWYLHKPQQIVKEVIVTKNVDRLVYRDYNKADCCAVAKAYDQTPFHQTFKVKQLNYDSTDVVLKWDLFERNGEQEIKVPVYQAGNWKFYAGLGLGGALVGAGSYGLYKLIK